LIGSELASETTAKCVYRILSRVGEGAMGVAFYAVRVSARGIECGVVDEGPAPLVRAPGGPAASLIVQKEAVALGRLNERVPPTPFVVRLIDTGTVGITHGAGRHRSPLARRGVRARRRRGHDPEPSASSTPSAPRASPSTAPAPRTSPSASPRASRRARGRRHPPRHQARQRPLLRLRRRRDLQDRRLRRRAPHGCGGHLRRLHRRHPRLRRARARDDGRQGDRRVERRLQHGVRRLLRAHGRRVLRREEPPPTR
jgi:hypothetical protein